jgi:hypothetical protein
MSSYHGAVYADLICCVGIRPRSSVVVDGSGFVEERGRDIIHVR